VQRRASKLASLEQYKKHHKIKKFKRQLLEEALKSKEEKEEGK